MGHGTEPGWQGSSDDRARGGPSGQLARLRGWRVWPERFGLGGALGGIRKGLAEAGRRDSAIEEAWARVAPAWARSSVRGVSLERGVLKLECGSASGRYRLDQWMRKGGLAMVRGAAPVSIRSYRVVTRSR
ncbi:MAG: hypothetical protein AAGI17_06855 [Planctomycetota bacterium]